MSGQVIAKLTASAPVPLTPHAPGASSQGLTYAKVDHIHLGGYSVVEGIQEPRGIRHLPQTATTNLVVWDRFWPCSLHQRLDPAFRLLHQPSKTFNRPRTVCIQRTLLSAIAQLFSELMCISSITYASHSTLVSHATWAQHVLQCLPYSACPGSGYKRRHP